MNSEDYKQQLIALLPQGSLWPERQTSNNLTRLLLALAEELARVDARANELLNEIFPDTTVKLLPDWERIAGLPDICVGQLTLLQERRNSLLGVLSIQRGLSRQFYIDVAVRLGYIITITEFLPFRAGSSLTGDALYYTNAIMTWQVNAPGTTIIYFRAGQSSAGDPLQISNNQLLECAMNALKPAHTKVTFNYT